MQFKILIGLALPAICVAAILPNHALVEARSPIMGGAPMRPGKIPYIVSVQSTQGEHQCGGSLISSTAVLTAHHCVQRFQAAQLSVRAGTIVNSLLLQIDDFDSLMQHSENPPGRSSSPGFQDCTTPQSPRCCYTAAFTWDCRRPEWRRPIRDSGSSTPSRHHSVCCGLVCSLHLLPHPFLWRSKLSLTFIIRGRFRESNPAVSSLLMGVSVRIQACEPGMSSHMFCTVNVDSGHNMGPCKGDSGGPILNRKSEIIGIHTKDATPCGQVGQLNQHLRMDALVDFVAPYVGG